MVDRTMADEILQRYANASHQELYEQLMAGDPEQIEGLAAQWRSAHDTVAGLGDTLRRDLAQLLPVWDSAAGREYQRRIEAVITFAEMLAGEFGDIRSGLTTMAEALREAQREAESPEATDDHDKLIAGAGAGALAGVRFGGVPGAVVGGVIGAFEGFKQDEAEKEAARQRMIQLVVQLSAEYRMTEQTNLTMELTGPPEELPIGSPDDRVTPTAVAPVVAPTPVPELKPSDPDGPGLHVVPPSPVSPPPESGTVSSAPGMIDGTPPAVDEPQVGTGLLGAGSGPLLGAAGTSTAGAGLSGLTGAGGLGAAGGGISPVPGGGSAGAHVAGLSGAPAGRGLSGVGDAAGDRAGATGARRDTASLSSRNDQRAATRGAQPGAEEEPDEYLTWLTEDEMVWSDEADAPPSVLGTAPPAPPQQRPEAG